jgi:glycosyltransferase 2 family protein
MKRRIILWVLVFASVALVGRHLSDLERVSDTLRSGAWQWMFVAVGLQGARIVLNAALYRSAFSSVGIRRRLWELLPVVLASHSLNVLLVAPSAGAAGNALLITDATRRGLSAVKTAVGVVLELVADMGASTAVVAAGVLYLFLRHRLQSYEIAGAALLALLTGGLTGVFLLGLWTPRLLRALLAWLQGAFNLLTTWVGRDGVLDRDWAEKHTQEFRDAAVAVRRDPRRLLSPLVVALLMRSADLVSLAAIFLAFHERIHAGFLFAGYAMTILFWIISPTPEGIGVVEGVMTLTFASFGVPSATAALVAIAYRGLAFWIPLLAGFVALHHVKTFDRDVVALTEGPNGAA